MSGTRREFITSVMGAACGLMLPGKWAALSSQQSDFSLKYIVASSMYGYMDLATILPEVAKAGAGAIDIWPKVHGNQREQLEEMGEEAFMGMLRKYQVKLGCITQYSLGPFNLKDELRLGQRLGCETMITGGRGPTGLEGSALKSAVRAFVERIKPQLEVAEETGIKIAIENHSGNLMESPDALKWLLEFRPSEKLGVALAPYHLPQDEELLSDLIRSLGSGIYMFYAWQHGKGSMEKLPKEQELLQMPGRGPLDFRPLLSALKDIDYQEWTEIFMHPYPRGIPILETASDVTEEINRARNYLTKCLEEL